MGTRPDRGGNGGDGGGRARKVEDEPEGGPQHEAEQEYVELEDDEFSDPAAPNTFPSGETVRADRRDALTAGHADRMPTPDEEEAAPTDVDPSVSDAYRDQIRRGAEVEGEGRI